MEKSDSTTGGALPSHPGRLPYSPEVDGLRAVAVVTTMWFHFFPSQLPGGFVGVDIFFVISGYLITGVILSDLSHGSFSLRTFYARRIRRILPALCIVLATVLAAGWFLLLANEYMNLGKQAVAAGGFASNIALIYETNYFNPISDTMPLLHLWSLGVEEQFYIFWPLIVALCWRSRGRLATATVMLAVVSFLFNLRYTPHDEVQAFYSPVTRVWELMVGALVALGHRSSTGPNPAKLTYRLNLSGALFLIGATLLLVSFFGIHPHDPFPGWRALLPTCGAALLIATRSPSQLHKLLLSNRLMVGIGLISYPLYLWHWPLLSYATILSSGEPSLGMRYLLLAATFALSIATYFCFEGPIRRGKSRRWKIVVPLVALAALTTFGGAVYHYQGFSHRPAALPVTPSSSKQPYQQSCQSITQNPHYNDDWCNPHLPAAPPTVLLLGDSLSAPYSVMLMELTKSHPFSFRQFARGQCPSLLDYGPQPCRELLAKVLRQDFIKDIQTVIITADWRSYVYGKHYIFFPDAHDDAADSFATALRTTVDYWEKLGKRVVILYSPPQGMNLEACVPRRFSLTDPATCRYTRKQAEERDAQYRSKLADILGQRPNVMYFDPFKFLCTESTCMVTSKGEYMYVDTVKSGTQPPFIWNHMSVYGAQYLARTAEAELTRLITSANAPAS